MKDYEGSGSESEDESVASGSEEEQDGASSSPAPPRDATRDSSSGSSSEDDEEGGGGGSDNESHNTSRTTKSSDNNESRNNVEDSDEEEEDKPAAASGDDGSGSDSGSGSGSGSGSDAGGGAGSDSDNNNSDDEDNNKSSSSASGRDGSSGDEEEGGRGEDGSGSDSSSSDGNKRSSKKQRPAWERNPDMYGVRRSGRDRRQPDRMAVQSPPTPVSDSRRAAAARSARWRGSESSCSESESGSPSPRRRPPPSKGGGATKRLSYEDRQIKRAGRSGGKVSYKEDESMSEPSDVSDAEEGEEGSQSKAVSKEQDENSQTIEKIIDTRIGKKGAVGMQTYLYEVEKNGDPNSDFDPSDPSQTERHFLIKWKSWAHLHNTWESEESLKTQKVKGLKKLENFFRKEEEILLWKNSATPEEIEYMEIQSELERELSLSHLKVDRVFATAEENGNIFYNVKWENLPYAEATWELESLIEDRSPDKIVTFKQRERSTCTPRQCPALKHRPKFSTIKEQPSYLGGDATHLILRDYQMQGLNWMVHAWAKHNSVILADEMGLGKTIQAISFISYLFHTHHMYGPYLLVLPLSTLNAWEREFALWAPDLNVIVYIGDRDSRKIIRDYEWAFPNKRLKFNVVLTTYEILLRDKDELKECMWSVMAIDEAHRLKNEESQLYQALKEFRTNHRLLITGTPLQNSLKELWALLHFIMPDKFDEWSYFESQHDMHKIEKGFHKLHKQLEPFLLRRVKKDVEKSLPAKVEQILRVDMTKEQKQYYKWILTKNYDMLRKGTRGSTSSFVNIVMELKKCCNHSFLTKPPDDIPSGSTEMLQQLLRGSGKLVLLDKLLMRLHETGHRVLIFSQMVRQLDILSQYLQLRRLPFQRLDGSIRGELRKQALDHFNADGSSDFCFLLSTRAGGLGINLATADTVIIFDSDWNPQNDLQAQARAHRIGQKNQVNIYRLVTKSSIEENIIERAKQKMVLDHLVIQSMDTSGRTVFNKKLNSNSNPFNKDELNAILKFGADELFKDDDEENDEPVCDIDEILRRAETREDGPASVGDDLLSAFKVASINLDEDEEVSKLDSVQEDSNRDWDDIIPESYLTEIKEKAKAKEMADLYLPPRSRKTVQSRAASGKETTKEEDDEEDVSSSSGSDKEDDEDGVPRKRGRGRAANKDKESIKGFSEAEVRRFFRSMKRFSNPTRRLDTISRDADLRDKPLPELRRLADTIIDRCRQFMVELEKQHQLNPDKEAAPKKRGKQPGNSFKLAGVSINAKTTLATLEELAPLDVAMPHAPVQRASWILPIKKVKDTHWDTIWTLQDDSRLLCGIYEYGMGSWDQIKADPALSLGDKILLDGEQKPQAKQLEARAQYLLKLLKKHGATTDIKPTKVKVVKPKGNRAAASKIKEPKGISREIIDDDSTDDEASNATTAAQSGNSAASTPKPPPQATTHTDSKDKEHVKETKEHKEKESKVKTKEEKPEKEPKVKEEIDEAALEKKKKSKKDKKVREKPNKGPVHITANGEPMPILDDREMDTSHPMWLECKEKMRPMKKHLTELSSGGGDNISEEQQIAHTKRCLLTIGDHITAAIANTNADHMDSWKVLLWRFVSKFTEYDAKKLHKFYKKTKKQEMHDKDSREKTASPEVKAVKPNNKEHRHKDHKDKSKDKEADKDKKSTEKAVKRKHEPEDNPDCPPKKSFNGNGAGNDTSRDRWDDREAKREREKRDERRSGESNRDANSRDNNSKESSDRENSRDGVRDSRDYRDRSRDRDRDRDRDRERNRDRDRSSGGGGGGGGGYRRHGGPHRDGGGWHKREGRYNSMGGGGYQRDGGYGGGGGYQRGGGGGGDWRGGGRPHHNKQHSNYGPPHPGGAGGYPPGAHFSPLGHPPMGGAGGPPHMYGGPPPQGPGPNYPPYRGDWGGPRSNKGRDSAGGGGDMGWQPPPSTKDRGDASTTPSATSPIAANNNSNNNNSSGGSRADPRSAASRAAVTSVGATSSAGGPTPSGGGGYQTAPYSGGA